MTDTAIFWIGCGVFLLVGAALSLVLLATNRSTPADDRRQRGVERQQERYRVAE